MLSKVVPRLEMNGDEVIGIEMADEGRSLLAAHRDLKWLFASTNLESRIAEVHERNYNMEALLDVEVIGKKNGVASKVDGVG